MLVEENKTLVRKYYDLYNQGNIEALREILDHDFVCYIGGVAEPIRGLDTNLMMDNYMRSAFSDIRFTVQPTCACLSRAFAFAGADLVPHSSLA